MLTLATPTPQGGEGGGGGAWIKQLRVLRAFRLFRLFGKMGQLKRIVTAVALSIVPTLQALVGEQAEAEGGGRGALDR